MRAAELLERMLEHWPDHGELAREILIVCEQEGDRITHDIIQRLNQTFVTPIDREDIYALASALDDIVDFIEEVADFLGALPHRGADGRRPSSWRGSSTRPAAQVADAIPRLRTLRATSATTRSRSTGSRTRATASCARRSRRCSSAGSTRWS